MQINQSPIGVIYRVGDLKAAFIAVKDELSQRNHAFNTNPEDLIPTLLRNATMALDLLNTFNDEELLALPAIPSEIAKATDPLSQPLRHYYENKQFGFVPFELGLNLEKK